MATVGVETNGAVSPTPGAILSSRTWIKVVSSGEKRVECLRIADVFKAEVVDAGLDHFIFQLQHRSDKLERFVSLMRSLGEVEIARTGVVAMTRGAALMHGRNLG